MTTSETCQAKEYYPRFKKCNNTNIHVYLKDKKKRTLKNRVYAICENCWKKIAKKDIGVVKVDTF